LAVEPEGMLIGGERVAAASGETFESISPATGEIIAQIPRGGAADVGAAVAAAQSAFESWQTTSPLERAARVNKLADLVAANAEELATIDAVDNGSPLREMRNDARVAVWLLRYFAGLALELRGETVPGDHDRLNYSLREPFGVVGRIIPFNHPFMFAVGKVAAPLIAGNTVILKPSEHTSLSALRLAELFSEALPPGVVNVVTGTGTEAGDALVVHPGVRRLAFIGSAEIGRTIQRRAAEHVVKTVTLELGGKNPIVIFPDADIEDAIEGTVRGMNFTFQGQSCGSTSRLLVHESIHDEFVQRLAVKLDAMRLGMPEDPETEIGAIVHRLQYEKVLGYLDIGRDEGAEVLAGGGPAEDAQLQKGMFVRPTLFDRVDPASRLASEEIFGPVLAAMTFSDFDQALAISNRVNLGLTASVYTKDLSTAHRFAKGVQAGYVWVNDTARHFPGAPYGGFKDSGIGREEGIEELFSYAQTKNVNVRF
jgi:acyl-CoA reductase-like NAD-dependent aldehyde dehydrogenase